MKRMLLLALLLAGASFAVGDEPEGDAGHAHDDAHAHAHAHGDGDGQTLHEIMHGLGAQMLSLTYALLHHDTDTIKRSAEAMAGHAPISREELDRIAHVLGDDAAEFDRLDEELHHAAVRLSEAAAADDVDAVLTRLNETQRACVACHAQFRERLETAHD